MSAKSAPASSRFSTLGGLGIWTFIDFIFIIVGHFKDKQGRRVSVWTD